MASVTVLDGGMGKALAEMGAPFRQPEWSAAALMEGPEWVERAHDEFVAAGAEVLTTNNYAVAPFHLGEDRFSDLGDRLSALAGELARRSADRAGSGVRVAGSLPPLFGSYRPDLFDAVQAPAMLARVVAALDPWVDVFLAETQSSLAEARCSAEAASRTGKPLWLAVTLRDEVPLAEGPAVLRSGESVAELVALASEMGAEAVLFNCSRPEVMTSAVLDAVAAADRSLAVGVYANAFEPVSVRGAANEVVSAHRADLEQGRWPLFVNDWLLAGATIVGGCCGVMPRHLAEIRGTVDRFLADRPS